MLSPRDRAMSQTSPFKTPMSFKPDSKHKPSPSRKDLWKAELGLDDDDSSPEDGQSSSGDEELEPEADQLSSRGELKNNQALYYAQRL
ncbi:glutamine and serine-rich protein 1-like [Orbicella faveolata]|uniref:glutamine and serine-rich protein 1-like n=1 Tax=Orbicella faveolata TaxID=48498 RepID=UPI0009E52991|nr:glutamine and serine-rich protein 1-like [Orbicella faveolata]